MTQNGPLRVAIPPSPSALFLLYGCLSGETVSDGLELDIAICKPDAIAEDASASVVIASGSVAAARRGDLTPLKIGLFALESNGPLVVTKESGDVSDLKAAKVALPGESTSESLVACTFLPTYAAVHLPADQLLDAVKSDSAAAAIVSREVWETQDTSALVIADDLGERFAKYHGDLPVPIHATCVRTDTPKATVAAVEEVLARSLAYARDHLDEAVVYIAETLPQCDAKKVRDFLASGVDDSHFTFSDTVRQALDVLEEYQDIDDYAANGRF